jgi:hypothetical protein
MSTRTKTPSRMQSTIGPDPEEFEAPGLESGERAAAAGPRRAHLAPDRIDDAVNRAQVRTAIGELPGLPGSRTRRSTSCSPACAPRRRSLGPPGCARS